MASPRPGRHWVHGALSAKLARTCDDGLYRPLWAPAPPLVTQLPRGAFRGRRFEECYGTMCFLADR